MTNKAKNKIKNMNFLSKLSRTICFVALGLVISNKTFAEISFSGYQELVARMFGGSIKFLPSRKGERYASALTDMNLSNKVHKRFGKINLKNYISGFY